MKTSRRTRFLSLILALVLSFSLCPAVLANLDPSDYSDVKEGHWAYDSIMYCSEWEIVKGYNDGRFCPENPVSGVEFIAMITRTFYADEVAAARSEMPAPWYWANVKAADDAHVTDNTAAVSNTPMSRYDMAAVLNNVIDGKNVVLLVSAAAHQRYIDGEIEKPLDVNWVSEKTKAAQQSIQDWDSVPDQYRDAVAMCYALGVLSGMSDGTFSGTQSMTRAQACTVMVRMRKLTNSYDPGSKDSGRQDDQDTGSINTAAINTAPPVEKTRPGKLGNGQDATPENVAAVLAEIKRLYPTGTPWGPSRTPNNNFYKYFYDENGWSSCESGPRDVGVLDKELKGGVGMEYACGGWMAMISEYLFGMTGAPCRRVTDPDKVRVGDITVSFDKNGRVTHYGIVATTEYRVNSNGIGYWYYGTCDGNMNGQVHWSTVTASRPSEYHHVYTRYPD